MQTLKRSLRGRTPRTYQLLRRLKHGLRHTHWRSKNLSRVLSYYLFAPSHGEGIHDDVAMALGDELRQEGIVTSHVTQAFQNSPQLFAQVETMARRLQTEARTTNREASARTTAPDPYRSKEYRAGLLPQQLTVSDPVIRLALDPRILGIVERYMGMRPYLRAIDLWWDRPTPGPAKETQLWHRDGDDVMNVKMFVYLNDVELDGGPFCFIPQTHPRGRGFLLTPECDAQCRNTDEQMAKVIPPSAWRTYTAPAGTMILCDTCGWHRGLKPIQKDRLLLMWHYTSGIPRYARTLTLVRKPGNRLSPTHLEVLGETVAVE